MLGLEILNFIRELGFEVILCSMIQSKKAIREEENADTRSIKRKRIKD